LTRVESATVISGMNSKSAPRRSPLDVSKMTAHELREAGVPYLVDPADLRMLGLDPNQYVRTIKQPGGGYLSGCMLDRTSDREIIYRLSTRHGRPSSTMRH
jgi:hypothetical protein